MTWNVNAQNVVNGGGGGGQARIDPPSVSNLVTSFDSIIKRLVDLEEHAAMLVGRLTGPATGFAKAENVPTPIDCSIHDSIVSRRLALETLVAKIEVSVRALENAL